MDSLANHQNDRDDLDRTPALDDWDFPCAALADAVALWDAAPTRRAAPAQSIRLALPLAAAASLLGHGLILTAVWAMLPPPPVHQQTHRPPLLAGDPFVSDDDTAPVELSVAPIEAPNLPSPEVIPAAPAHPRRIDPADLPPIPDTSIVARAFPPMPDSDDQTHAPSIGITTDPFLAASRLRLSARLPERALVGALPSTLSTSPVLSTQPSMARPATVNLSPPRIIASRAAVRRGARGGFDDRGLPIPDYPSEAKMRRQEGVVELDVEVRDDGNLGEVRVIKDPGFPLLVKAAIDAVRRGKFEPASRDGHPIAGHLVIPYRFTLE